MFGAAEVVTYLPWYAPDPTDDELQQIAAAYVKQGGGSGTPGDGDGVATARVVEWVVMFPEYPLTAAQQGALSGLPRPSTWRSGRDVLLPLYGHLDGTSGRRWSKSGPLHGQARMALFPTSADQQRLTSKPKPAVVRTAQVWGIVR